MCCFFSSLEKILISDTSEFKNFSRTALPKEPVPPVIKNILSLKNLKILSFYTLILFNIN